MRLSYTVNTLVTKQTIGIFKIHDGKNLFMVLNYNKDEVHHLFCFFSMCQQVSLDLPADLPATLPVLKNYCISLQ